MTICSNHDAKIIYLIHVKQQKHEIDLKLVK